MSHLSTCRALLHTCTQSEEPLKVFISSSIFTLCIYLGAAQCRRRLPWRSNIARTARSEVQDCPGWTHLSAGLHILSAILNAVHDTLRQTCGVHQFNPVKVSIISVAPALGMDAHCTADLAWLLVV